MRHPYRRNPPLAEHMQDESYDAIFMALRRRIHEDPSEALEFAYSVVMAAHNGIMEYQEDMPEYDEYSDKGRLDQHLTEALEHLEDALQLMHGE